MLPLVFYSMCWYIKYQIVLLSIPQYDAIIYLMPGWAKTADADGERYESFSNRGQWSTWARCRA